ncbi:MAG: nicotinate-nucleotide adenylyltransferase [Gemmataceae bacterium]
MPTSRKIGILGGTFDPVHLGHLITAEQAREQAALDQVWFVPASRPPHKTDRDISPIERRIDMLELALAGQPAFRIDPLEKERPGPSFTVDTLHELSKKHPDVDFQLILGSDCLPDLPGWRDPVGIVTRAGLLIVTRPSWNMWSAEQLRQELGLPAEHQVRLQVIDNPLCDISSSDIRRRVAERRSIRFLTPRAVEQYIAAHRLYQS